MKPMSAQGPEDKMLDAIRSFFRPRPQAPLPAVPEGERYYLIGDIHGRLDLFEAMVAAIEDDDTSRDPSNTQVILLGDLVDRGAPCLGADCRNPGDPDHCLSRAGSDRAGGKRCTANERHNRLMDIGLF